jgi:uncharacterized Zn-binding protein involved in type VI secretion
MTNLDLSGPLNLAGMLDLKPSGKVTIAKVEALVQGATGQGAPVPLPPPAGTKVTVRLSFNSTVTANGKAIVTQGVTMQGDIPTWPGVVQPSTANKLVTVNHIPINVVGDLALTLPTGTPAPLTTSGQSTSGQ